MTVLVLGGTGFIGAPLMRALARRGVQALAVGHYTVYKRRLPALAAAGFSAKWVPAIFEG